MMVISALGIHRLPITLIYQGYTLGAMISISEEPTGDVKADGKT